MAEVKQSKQVLKVLKDTRAILTKRGAWTKFANARDKDGFAVWVHSDDAVTFCLSGAIERAGGTQCFCYGSLYVHLNAFLPAKYGCLIDFNDYQQTKTPVIELLEKAIAQLEQTLN